MKRKGIIIVAVLAIVAIVAAFVLPRKKEVAFNSDSPYKFYYYPKLNAYYDFQNKDFVYTLDGGKSWMKKDAASEESAEKLSQKVLISGHNAEAWQFNAAHRQAYHGVSSDFLGKETNTPEPTPVTAAQSMPAPEPEQQQFPDQPEDNINTATNAEQIEPLDVPTLPEQEWESMLEQEAGKLLEKGITKGREKIKGNAEKSEPADAPETGSTTE